MAVCGRPDYYSNYDLAIQPAYRQYDVYAYDYYLHGSDVRHVDVIDADCNGWT
ncbi:hypothetical protein D3C76_1646650 [compost metagenome]